MTKRNAGTDAPDARVTGCIRSIEACFRDTVFIMRSAVFVQGA